MTVTVGGELVETDANTQRMWTAAYSTSFRSRVRPLHFSSLVTLATPGVAADSYGLFDELRDHASNFSIDGQPITDQQSKVFSNQLPVDAVQSMEVLKDRTWITSPTSTPRTSAGDRPGGLSDVER